MNFYELTIDQFLDRFVAEDVSSGKGGHPIIFYGEFAEQLGCRRSPPVIAGESQIGILLIDCNVWRVPDAM